MVTISRVSGTVTDPAQSHVGFGHEPVPLRLHQRP